MIAALLGMTVGELRDRMTYVEFLRWIEWDQIVHFSLSERRADIRAGIIASTIANVNSTRRMFTAEEFIPRFKEPAQEMTDEQMKDVCIRANAMLRGKFNG